MLIHLLPGIRTLRAPSAAGSLFLAAIYLVAVSAGAADAVRDGIGFGLAQIIDWFGRPGVLAVFAVSAYLLGDVYLTLSTKLTRRINIRLLQSLSHDEATRSDQRQVPHWQRVLVPLSCQSVARLRSQFSLSDDELCRVCHDIVVNEGKRLIVANRDAWHEFDRLVAEAQFRDAIALPMVIFTAAAVFESSPPFLIGIAIFTSALGLAGITYVAARRADRKAMSTHAYLVAEGIVSTAYLDQRRQ